MTNLESNSSPPPPAGKSNALRQLLLVFGMVAALLLCGCASRRARWKRESFALDVPSVSQAGSAAHTNVLSLHRVTVSPLFEGQPLVYRTGEYSYEQDPYAAFFVTPNRMLEQCLRTYLRNGHAFADLPDQGSSLKSSYSMEVSVSQLYGDFRQTNQLFAVLQLHFILYSTELASHGRVLWQREFSKRLPIAQRTPAALIAGWNAGLKQIMDEANTDLKRLDGGG
ncbi:MAG: uncharacterized protein JWR26_1286 [Pedosphaera sp.]|nr:uncharacterized protein [Pedosphaera sp.]